MSMATAQAHFDAQLPRESEHQSLLENTPLEINSMLATIGDDDLSFENPEDPEVELARADGCHLEIKWCGFTVTTWCPEATAKGHAMSFMDSIGHAFVRATK